MGQHDYWATPNTSGRMIGQIYYEGVANTAIAVGDTGAVSGVPEPSSIALLAIGPGGLLALRRRRQQGR